MNKWILLLLALGCSSVLFAQQDSPVLPKLLYHPSVIWHGYYTLDGHRVTEQEVRTHFSFNNGEALRLFDEGDRMDRRGIRLIYIAAGGALLALITDSRPAQIAGLGTMYVAGGIGVGLTIFSNRRKGQALNRYNRDAGY